MQSADPGFRHPSLPPSLRSLRCGSQALAHSPDSFRLLRLPAFPVLNFVRSRREEAIKRTLTRRGTREERLSLSLFPSQKRSLRLCSCSVFFLLLRLLSSFRFLSHRDTHTDTHTQTQAHTRTHALSDSLARTPLTHSHTSPVQSFSLLSWANIRVHRLSVIRTAKERERERKTEQHTNWWQEKPTQKEKERRGKQ